MPGSCDADGTGDPTLRPHPWTPASDDLAIVVLGAEADTETVAGGMETALELLLEVLYLPRLNLEPPQDIPRPLIIIRFMALNVFYLQYETW